MTTHGSRQFTAALCLISSVLIAHSGPLWAAPASISKTEVRTEFPDVTHKKLREVVWEMFEKEDLRSKKAPQRPLTTLFLKTKKHATRVPGLCRYDTVRVEMDHAGLPIEEADAPMFATGLTSTSYFSFLLPPAGEYFEMVQGEPAGSNDCAHLNEDDAFFAAEDEVQATDGYRAFLALVEAARAGRQFPLQCDLHNNDKLSCIELVAAFQPGALSEVAPCEVGPDWGTVCQRITVGERQVDVRLTAHVSPGPPAGQLVSAKLTSLLVMWHEAID